MNRRKFITLLSSLAAAFKLSWLFKRTPPPAPSVPYPLPWSALTGELVRAAWEQARPNHSFSNAMVVIDPLTMEYLQGNRTALAGMPGAQYMRALAHLLKRFDVVDGKRVDIPFNAADQRWYTAPFQDHPIFDGKEIAATVSVRRILPTGHFLRLRNGEEHPVIPTDNSIYRPYYPVALKAVPEGPTAGDLAQQHLSHLRDA